MSNPREKMHLYGQYSPVAELDAPQPRTTRRVPVADNLIFELSGESVAYTRSNAEDIISSTEDHTIPQANPWPFYLDDAKPSRPVNKGGLVSHTTTVLEQQPANPWPFHGIDVELHESCDDSKWEKESLHCHNTMVLKPFDQQVPLKAASSGSSENKSNVSDDAEMLTLLQTSNKAPGCLDTRFDPVSPLDPFTALPLHDKACGNLTCEMVKEDSGCTEPSYQEMTSEAVQEKLSALGTEIKSTTSVYIEQAAFISPCHEVDTQNASPREDNMPTPQAPFVSNVQPCLPAQNLAFISGSSNPSTETGPHCFFAVRPVESYKTAQSARPSTEWQTPISGSTTSREAPPLPPRPRHRHPPLVGLSEGPHSNVPYPPPPKRSNLSATRSAPPLPQRPHSSSKFFGSSSAKRWLDKTNQVIEGTLDSVLQGPALHPNRPAYASHPSTHSPQQTTQLPANQFLQRP